MVLWGKIPNISSRVNITELPSAAALPFVRFSERERSSIAPQILYTRPAGRDRNARCRVCKPHGCTRITPAAFSAGPLRVSSQVRAEMERVASGDRDVPEATGSSTGQRTGKRRGGFRHGNPSLGVSKAQHPKALGLKMHTRGVHPRRRKGNHGAGEGRKQQRLPNSHWVRSLPHHAPGEAAGGRKACGQQRPSLPIPASCWQLMASAVEQKEMLYLKCQ